MTREETKKLLMLIQAVYPNFNVKPDQMTFTIDAWHMMVKEYTADSMLASLQIYIKSNGTAFAPSVSQLIDGVYKPQDNQVLTEGEAWSLVKRAIQDGNYHAEERYNDLPPLVQKAVGSPNMIHQWAGTDSDEVNTVIMSNFQRSYRSIVQREQENVRINPIIAGMIESTEEKMLGVTV